MRRERDRAPTDSRNKKQMVSEDEGEKDTHRVLCQEIYRVTGSSSLTENLND